MSLITVTEIGLVKEEYRHPSTHRAAGTAGYRKAGWRWVGKHISFSRSLSRHRRSPISALCRNRFSAMPLSTVNIAAALSRAVSCWPDEMAIVSEVRPLPHFQPLPLHPNQYLSFSIKPLPLCHSLSADTLRLSHAAASWRLISLCAP